MSKWKGPARLVFLAAAVLTVAEGNPKVSHAQQSTAARQYDFDIPSTPIAKAVNDIARIAGLAVVYRENNPIAGVGKPVKGRMSPEQALAQLLSGTGVRYQFSNATTVAIFAASGSEAASGDTVLAPITLKRGRLRWDGGGDGVYETPSSVAFISEEQIDRYRGTAPADMLKNTAGVLSGESRNSGSLDVNIRGMQGQGRVPVTVDGTINSTSVYRGYQGVGNRTFVDPDFIGGVNIEKGASSGPAGAGAIGGLVEMRTINADDIVKDGNIFGLRIKGDAAGNTTSYGKGTQRSMLQPNNGILTNIERPDFLDTTAGSGSIVGAMKTEYLDLLAGYSRRRFGNYHAGSNGDDAPQETSAPADCSVTPADCAPYVGWYTPGITRYLPGEEVLNTSESTKSSMGKATLHLDDHEIEFNASRYQSEYGETYPQNIQPGIDTIYAQSLSNVDLKRYGIRYHYDPESELVDLRASVWKTDLVEQTPISGGYLGDVKWVKTTGADISNISRFSTGFGDLSFQYGGAYLEEATGPEEEIWNGIPSREGERTEKSLFIRANWKPLDWLALDGGLRYQSYEIADLSQFYGQSQRDGTTNGFNLGVTVEPFQGISVFGRYFDASRLPSLMEGTRGFLLSADPGLGPETAHNFELGVNVNREGVLTSDDRLGVKLAYFHNDIHDYISRRYNTSTFSMRIYNIDRAKFEGLELSAHYETGTFTADLSANYYTNVEFCRTADTCVDSSLAADYATNQVPPEYSLVATLSKSFLDEKLTVSGRISHIGPRAADAETPGGGGSSFIRAMPWNPYTLIDVFASYKVGDHMTLDLGIENLTDVYYIEPLSFGLVPSPGRTFKLGLTATF
jgi:hemoglobin/transferrin/lactoferrin receptor protein